MAESVDFGSSVILASDETYCAPCNKDGNVVPAEGFCVDCSEYLCGQCYKSHRRFKSMENHVLKDKESMLIPVVSTSEEIIDVCVEKCSNHPSKVAEFFCRTCDFLGCYACITVHHRQCEKVVHIPDIVKESETVKEFTDFHKKLESIAKRLTDHNKKIQVNIETNLNMKKLAKDELKTQRAEINKFLDELEKKLDIEIENIEKENNRTLNVASDRLESMEKCFDEMRKSIELKKNGQNCELFISMKKSKKIFETLDDGFDKLFDDSRIQRYTVLPSEQIHAMMETTTEICRMTTARLVSMIEIRTSNDKKNPDIQGLTTVHGHFLVVSDGGNNTLKVFDTRSGCVISEIGIDATCLWGLATVDDDQVAVSVSFLGGKQEIQFFSVSASGVVKSTAKQFGVQSVCVDFDSFRGKLYLCQINHLLICNIAGQTIMKIDRNAAGVAMFKNLQSISLSPDFKTIYVTDYLKKSVTSMTLDGSVNAIYKDKKLESPWGITVDNKGYIYVASQVTNTIHQLTADLSRGQIIVDNVEGKHIIFSSTENKLFISDFCSYVSVYDLKNH